MWFRHRFDPVGHGSGSNPAVSGRCAHRYADPATARCLASFMAMHGAKRSDGYPARDLPTRPRNPQGRPTARSLTEIVEAIRGGDESRWAELVHRLSGAARSSLARFNVDPELRNDAAAETWRSLFERLDSINDPESLPRWVAVVARNKMIDIIRRAGPGRSMVDIDSVAESVGSPDEDCCWSAKPARRCDGPSPGSPPGSRRSSVAGCSPPHRSR